MTGERYGRLTVIGGVKDSPGLWECVCDCGNKVVAETCYLRSGHKRSCGCLLKETRIKNGEKRRIHGMFGSRLYDVWHGMKARCYRETHPYYNLYGGRGIKVCNEWRDSFQSFAEWALRTGYDANAKRGQCTLDRIDTNGDYEPNNCRWADASTQLSNRRKYKSRGHWKAVECLDNQGNVLGRYDNAGFASEATGASRKSIGRVCRGTQHTAGGYRWRYCDTEQLEADKGMQCES